MSANTTGTTPGRGIPVWLLIVALMAVAAIAGGTAWYLASRMSGDDQSPDEEATVASESESEGPAVEAEVEPESPSAQPPGPTYVRYAYVRAVTGAPGAWEASLDLFDIFTGAEASAYATAHGMTVPGNGILYVNESETPDSIPLSDAAVITYNTGGVEGLETHSATIQQLRDYAAGSTTAMPDAFRDQWRITVESGVLTRVEMIAVAD